MERFRWHICYVKKEKVFIRQRHSGGSLLGRS